MYSLIHPSVFIRVKILLRVSVAHLHFGIFDKRQLLDRLVCSFQQHQNWPPNFTPFPQLGNKW